MRGGGRELPASCDARQLRLEGATLQTAVYLIRDLHPDWPNGGCVGRPGPPLPKRIQWHEHQVTSAGRRTWPFVDSKGSAALRRRAVPDAELSGVATTSPRDTWAVGTSGGTGLQRSRGVIEHWNGRAWTVQAPG